MEQVFTPLAQVPDHPRLEEEILQWWEDEGVFQQLRDRNRGNPRWSFIDGPVTANKEMGVHTAWGRTLKDVFQRYKALRGFDQRYQNGFDCQGLWIEVGVERELGLNSKRDIEEYGLEKFAAKCRDVVVHWAGELTRASKRLGQWMDWGNDYFTFSDTNIEYIWLFLRIVHDRGWLYLGHRSTEWCPRCGTSLSQHELTQAGVYQERADPSLFVRLPLLDREHEYLVVWTTTPWTLPGNVAAAVDPKAQYGRRDNGEWVAVARYPDETFEEVLRGERLVGWRYRGPFDHAHWEQWFPAQWVSEMREQIRLWFYSLMFMSVALTGKAPYRQVLTYEKLLDVEGREMHGSWGNLIEAEEAFERMGADAMRWLYCEQPPTQNIRFGFGPAEEVKRRLLTLWNSVKFFVDYANVAGFRPRLEDLEAGPPEAELQPLDRWIVSRTRQFVAEATAAYETFLTVDVISAFDEFVDDLSNWYIRRSRRRFWDGEEVALRTLWHALAQAVRLIGPVMPFLAEHLWRNLAGAAVDEAPASVFLAGWPDQRQRDEALLAEVAEVRRVVRLGHIARPASRLKVRQPLRRLVVEGAELSDEHAAEVREELRVKELTIGRVEATELHLKPNLPVLGPKLGKELAAVRSALEAGEFAELDGGRFRAAGHDLAPDEVLVERRGKEGWAVASEAGVTVALDTALDPELELEGLVLDLIHQINSMRKEQGLELTDRIRITLPATQKKLLQHADWIKEETLAVEIEADGGS